jgi:hypothetical protein
VYQYDYEHDRDYSRESKGSYSYNGEDKTITLAVEQILNDGGKWLNKIQAKNEAENNMTHTSLRFVQILTT